MSSERQMADFVGEQTSYICCFYNKSKEIPFFVLLLHPVRFIITIIQWNITHGTFDYKQSWHILMWRVNDCGWRRTSPGCTVWPSLRFPSWSTPAVAPSCLLSVSPAEPTDPQTESPPEKPSVQLPWCRGCRPPTPHRVTPPPVEAAKRTAGKRKCFTRRVSDVVPLPGGKFPVFICGKW